jgi:hypothetical protein
METYDLPFVKALIRNVFIAFTNLRSDIYMDDSISSRKYLRKLRKNMIISLETVIN